MLGEEEKLSKAFEIKEECEGYISNLEKLKSEGSITPDIYSSLRSEYEQKLKASLSEIDRIKNDINNLLIESLQEKDVLTDDLKKLEIKSSRDVASPAKEIHATPPEIQASTRETPFGKRIKLPSRRILMAIGAVVALIIVIVVVVLLIPGGGKQIEQVTIPVNIKGGNNIGSIQFELIYDTVLLEPLNVKAGPVIGDALFESNINGEGRVIVGMVSSAGISRDGSIAEITFKINPGDKESTPLVMDKVSAYNSLDISRISVSFIAGSYKTKDNSFVSPTIFFTAPPGK